MIKEALEMILDEFRRRYGVEVDIDVRVHWMANDTKKPSRELAERIVGELAAEIGGTGTKPRHVVYERDGEKTAWVDMRKDTITITVFYPSYHTEGENARDC